NFPAFRAAAAIIFCSTFCALNKQQVASAVFAIGMGIGMLAALVAAGDYFPGNRFAQTVVEQKVLSAEFIFKSSFPHCIGIMDDTAFQVIHLLKSLVQQKGTGF